jgi:hypothetical protein
LWVLLLACPKTPFSALDKIRWQGSSHDGCHWSHDKVQAPGVREPVKGVNAFRPNKVGRTFPIIGENFFLRKEDTLESPVKKESGRQDFLEEAKGLVRR